MEVGRARLAGYARDHRPGVGRVRRFQRGRRGGRDAVALAREPELDAVFAASDLMAGGALRALRDAGLGCRGCALVGFEERRWPDRPNRR